MYPGIELRLLRYAVAVAEELHFGRAAQRLHVSQPTLSNQILQLEDYLGFKLFIRTKRSVELTAAGRTFVAEAKKALHYSQRAVDLAKKAERGEHETLTVGYSPQIDLHFLSELRRMKPIGSERPVYKSSFTAEIVSKLLSHEFHAGLVIMPVVERELAVTPLLREPLALALPGGHPLGKKAKIGLRDLTDEPLIFAPRRFNPHFHDHLVSLFWAAGVTPVIAHEVTNPHEALHLVSVGLGIAIAQVSVLQPAKRDVVVKTFADEHLIVETAIACHRNAASPVLKLFTEAVVQTRNAFLAQKGRQIQISA